MNKEQLDIIIEKYYSFDNLLQEKFRIDEDENFDLIIVSPTWKPYFVFNEDYNVEPLKQGSVASYKLSYKGKKVLYIKIGKGAPYMYDNLLLLRNIDSPYLFLGSTGSLDSNINIGDIVVPTYSISGDGASLYFQEQLCDSHMFNKIAFDNIVRNRILHQAFQKGIEIKQGSVYCTDSLIGEYYHLDKIKSMQASCIEQETAAFGRCLEIMGKTGAPILVVSDSLVNNQNFYEPLENKKEYIDTRTKKLQRIIEDLY